MWDWDFAWEILPRLLSAVPVSIAATLVGFVFGCVLALLLVFAQRSGIKPLVWFVNGYQAFIRSTPLLVQLYFIFYAAPSIGIRWSAFTAGVIGLGLHYSTYLSEVFRAGIEAVPQGQWEAATALNFSKVKTWRRIVLPQAVPITVPVMGNYLIAMFKETPLLSAITVVEVTQIAKMIGAQTFRFVEPFTLIGIIFIVFSNLWGVLVWHLEERLNRRHRSA